MRQRRSHFAWLRTRASVERTLMSWIRTAVSLIGFGFAIVQFFSACKKFQVEPALIRMLRGTWGLR